MSNIGIRIVWVTTSRYHLKLALGGFSDSAYWHMGDSLFHNSSAAPDDEYDYLIKLLALGECVELV